MCVTITYIIPSQKDDLDFTDEIIKIFVCALTKMQNSHFGFKPSDTNNLWTSSSITVNMICISYKPELQLKTFKTLKAQVLTPKIPLQF